MAIGTDTNSGRILTELAGAAKAREQLAEVADIVGLGDTIDFGALLDDLGTRGVRQLMVEGGTHIHTDFLY